MLQKSLFAAQKDRAIVFYLIKQQIPKADAQFPWGVPPASPHSLEVIQTPLVAGSVF